MAYQKFLSISILTPVYNQACYIAETVDSILSQDYPNLEYLVIDDGSTDRTFENLKTYSNLIRMEKQSNMGETATVNRGVNQLNGEIIGIVNGDDPLLPGALNAVAECFIARPEVVVVYPDWKMIDANGQLLEFRKVEEYDYAKMVRRHDCLPGPGAFFKRDLFVKLNGRDTSFRYVADFDFWLRSGLIGPFTRIPQTLATHRWYTGGASTSARGTEMASEHIRLMDKFFSLPNLPVEIIEIKKEAYSSAYFTAGVCCGENVNLRKAYFTKAIKMAPFKYLGEYRRLSFEMLNTFSPSIYSLIYFLYKKNKEFKSNSYVHKK